MTKPIELERILDLLHQDRDLYELLREAGFLPHASRDLTVEHADTARVVGTLIHELEVNWAGAEVILRMRSELLATRRQVVDLLEMLRDAQANRSRSR